MQGDRRARAVAIREVLLGEHLAHGARPQQIDHRRQVHARQPLAVAADLQPARGLEIQQCPRWVLAQAQLHEIGLGIGLHLGRAELHPGGALARGITDTGREISDDQHGGVAGVLEGPQLAKQDRVAEMDVGSGGVDAELDAQGPAQGFGLR